MLSSETTRKERQRSRSRTSFSVASSDHRRYLPQTDCLLLSFVHFHHEFHGREGGWSEQQHSTLSGAGATQKRERRAEWQQALAQEGDRRQMLSTVPHSHADAHRLLLPISRSAITRSARRRRRRRLLLCRKLCAITSSSLRSISSAFSQPLVSHARRRQQESSRSLGGGHPA